MNCPWNNQWHWLDHRRSNFKTVRADCAVSACSPLPSPTKALGHSRRAGESAFGQESSSPLPRQAQVAGLWNEATFPPFSPLYWLLSSEQRETPRWVRLRALITGPLRSRNTWLARFPWAVLPPWCGARGAVRNCRSGLAGPKRGLRGDIPSSCRIRFVSGILPVSPLLGTGCQRSLFFGGMETCIWMSWRAPRPSKSVHRGAAGLTSLWARSTIWLFRQLVLTWVWCPGAFVLGTLYWLLSWRICASSVFWCVYSTCVIGIFLVFYKMGDLVQFIWKILAMRLWLKKKKDNFFNNIWQQYLTPRKKWVKMKLFWNSKTGSFCICSYEICP